MTFFVQCNNFNITWNGMFTMRLGEWLIIETEREPPPLMSYHPFWTFDDIKNYERSIIKITKEKAVRV